jgi:hypothetical protein
LIELASWLVLQRREAKMSLAALSEKTKIMVKHLEALEQGDLAALPTLVHARAFALAYARGCGADEDEALRRVAEALSPKKEAPEGPAQAKGKAAGGAKAAALGLKAAAALPVSEAAPSAAPVPAAPEPWGGSSQKLPWKTWSLVAASSVAFLLLLHGVVSCVRGATAKAPAPLAAPVETPAPQDLSPTVNAVPEELALRAKRPCWVALVIDGKRLPVVFLEPDKRERWMVGQKAVLLAGNIGAVRVWWRGDNLGYFGELGERMNGVVFEAGKPWRKDPSEDLALPPGVPSQAPK